MSESTGYSIQLYMADGTPDGLVIATQFGWTGQLTVCRQTTFDSLMRREDLDRPGVYILYGPDPEQHAQMRAYIGEADSLRDRIPASAEKQDFWESAVAITASDNALTKGHVRYLEARLIEMTRAAARANLANTQQPGAEKRYLPEADKANMERFLRELKSVLPVVGFDLLKPLRRAVAEETRPTSTLPSPQGQQKFEIFHQKSGVRAQAVEDNSEIVVLKGSEALKNSGYVTNQYSSLKDLLIKQRVLQVNQAGDRYAFTQDYAFDSPSAAAAIVLDRNSNGRIEWKVQGQKKTFHEWQSQSRAQGASESTK
jgi:hypothetical protein